MITITKISKQFRLEWRDFTKGLLLAIVTSILVTLQASIDAGEFVLNWKNIAMSGLGGGIAYLLKNYFEPTKTVTIEKK